MNDDEFGHHLADRLHRGEPPAPGGLLAGSLARSRVLRRRRRVTGAVAAVASAAMVGGVVFGIGGQLNRAPTVLASPPLTTVAVTASDIVTTPPPSETSAVPPTPPSASAPSASGEPPVTPDSPPTVSGSPRPPATGPSGSGTAAALPLCRAATTAVTVSVVQGAAGSVEYAITATNTGTTPCVLVGFPGVSIVAGDTGTQVGAAAVREEIAPTRLVLQPQQHGTATALLTQAANYGDDCQATPGRGFRIYLPEERSAKFAALDVTGCANPKIELLRVRPFA